MFERFLIRLYKGHNVIVPTQQQLLQDRGVRNVLGVLRSIAPDFHSTASTTPMFPHDARRLCSVIGFGTKDLCDKFAIQMLCCYGLRFVDLQRYKFKDFRMNDQPPMVQLLSWKNGTQLYSWVKLKDSVATYATEYFSRAGLGLEDRVFQYAMPTADSKDEMLDTLEYFESGRSNFSGVLNTIATRAGYPTRFFTPHSGASGFVTNEALEGLCRGESLRATLDRVCVETGRWMVGSNAILRYVSPHIARISSLLKGQSVSHRLAEYKMLHPKALQGIKVGPMCRKLCTTAYFGDRLRACRTVAEILGEPAKDVVQGDFRAYCARVATLLMKGYSFDHTLSEKDTRSLPAEGKFVHWLRRKMPSNLSHLTIREQVRSILRQAITPLVLLSLLSPSAVEGKPQVRWPLPAAVQTYVLLPTHQSVVRSHGQVGGTYVEIPEVRANENSLTRRDVQANVPTGQGAMASYMSKRARVTKAVVVEGKDGSHHVSVPLKYQSSFRLKQASPLGPESKQSRNPPAKRRKVVPWSKAEANALKMYVEKKGMKGQWMEILKQERLFANPRFLARRTSVDLKVRCLFL